MKKKDKLIINSILGIYLLILVALQLRILFFNSLPSPIYGGDYYYQAGFIEHILSGGNPFSSSALIGGVPGYLPFYAFLIVPLALVFGTFKGMLIGSIIFSVLSVIINFKFFKRVTKNDYLSLFLVGAFITPILLLKYTNFSRAVLLPLFLWFLYDFFEENNRINSIKLGLIWGIISISNTTMFISASLLIFIFFIYYLIKRGFNSNFYNYFISGGLAFLFAILIWFRPIFVFGMRAFYDKTHMDLPNFGSFSVMISFAKFFLKELFLTFNSFKSFIISFLVIVGFLMLYFRFNKENFTFHKILIFSMVGIIFSYFLTELFGFNLFPTFQKMFLFNYIQIFIIIYGYDFLKEKTHFIEKILLILGIVFLIIGLKSFNTYLNEDQWSLVAKNEISPQLTSVSAFLKENSSVNSVIITTKENAFAINSVTGRKFLTLRWAQNNDPYINLPQRDLDQAVILYGNNSFVRSKLLEEYSVDYLYWDYYWSSSEFSFDQTGNIVGWYDPLISYDSDENRQYLFDNNVSYFMYKFWVDPSARRDDVKKYDLIYISPENYYSSNHPWSLDLDKYLEEVWTYEFQGQVIARLFEVKR